MQGTLFAIVHLVVNLSLSRPNAPAFLSLQNCILQCIHLSIQFHFLTFNSILAFSLHFFLKESDGFATASLHKRKKRSKISKCGLRSKNFFRKKSHKRWDFRDIFLISVKNAKLSLSASDSCIITWVQWSSIATALQGLS